MGRGALLLLLTLALATAAAAALPPSPSTPNPPHDDDLAALQSSFAFLGPKPRPPYPVKWADDDDASPAHDLHVDPGMLFLRKSLFPGAILPEGTKFTTNAASQSFLSRAAAEAIPFGSNHLDAILSTFRIPRGSTVADQVAATLRTCEEPSPPPEPHVCATSRQAEAAFAANALGVTSEPRAVVAVVHGEEDVTIRYAVGPNGVARIGKEVVACHPMPYPYMVHYCHRPAASVEVLRVELTRTDAGGGGATVVAMCHGDTASWDGRYFRMLNATRGEEICHFMPRGYVLWLPAA
ncbi:hypothetical protein HU200_043657 [Digitaria exilis]|uniref:BURP domain-containing protein n=1 Tax=Digitaria exilis TaxID=1010633 RepID=A0A835BAZ3_9POAL|nr:hypothetical protein HU200_043657 [Digitaria exilis]